MAALVAGDLVVFAGLGTAIDMMRAGVLVGARGGALLQNWLPLGYLGGWHYGVALLIGLTLSSAYRRGDARHHGVRLLGGVALATGLPLWQNLWTAGLLVAGTQYLITLAGVGAALAAFRVGAAKVAGRVLPKEYRDERVIFIGRPKDEAAMAAHSQVAGRAGMMPIGWVTDVDRGDGQYLGHADEIWEILRRETVDTVVMSDALPDEAFASVFEAAAAAGCRVLALSRYEKQPRVRPGFVWHHGVPFIELTMPTLRAQQLFMKRIIDLVASAAGLLLLSPLFLLIAVAIKLDTKGLVMFSQERAGFGGRVFRLYKFRTMGEGADSEKGEVAHLNRSGDSRLFKVPNDPRITRVGRFLRRWSLDELPQLWNVLIGEMSLVGPRPFFENDLAEYSDHHFSRLAAKPGITGLWQVEGRSDVVDFEEVVRYDSAYIDRWSLWLDFKILVRTFPAVFRRTGAY